MSDVDEDLVFSDAEVDEEVHQDEPGEDEKVGMDFFKWTFLSTNCSVEVKT